MDNNENREEYVTETARRTVNTFRILVYSLILISIWNTAVDLIFRNDARNTLEILKEQTSPERQAQNEARLGQILVTLDCNNREALEEAFLQAGSEISVVEENCEN